jgi:protease PrsW
LYQEVIVLSRNEQPFITTMKKRGLYGFFLFVILPVIFVIYFSPYIFKVIPDKDIHHRINAAQKTNNRKVAINLYRKLIKEDPLKIDYHYRYVLLVVSGQKSSSKRKSSGNKDVLNEYMQMLRIDDSEMKDIANYSIGLIHSIRHENKAAIRFFNKVQNQSLKYLNNSTGSVYHDLKQFKFAEAAYWKEIENEGNIHGAVNNLSNLMYEQGRYDEVLEFNREDKYKPYISTQILRNLSLRKYRFFKYFYYIIRSFSRRMNIIGFLGSVIGVFIWYFFLRRLDIFEPEKHRYLIYTFFGGVISSFFAIMLYDYSEILFNIRINGELFNDLYYCIFIIGFFEEFVKLVPFLLVIYLSREANESIDFIIYASVSALGFAFCENLLYFSQGKIYVMEGRILISSLIHMICTSIVAYGIILARYKKIGNVFINTIIFFIAACILHGLYDYWIICAALPKAACFLTMFITIFAIKLYRWMIVNSLNQSEFYNNWDLNKLVSLREYLGMALISVVIFQFLAISWKFGPDLAMFRFFRTFIFVSILVYFLSFYLSRYELKQYKWMPFSNRKMPPGNDDSLSISDQDDMESSGFIPGAFIESCIMPDIGFFSSANNKKIKRLSSIPGLLLTFSFIILLITALFAKKGQLHFIFAATVLISIAIFFTSLYFYIKLKDFFSLYFLRNLINQELSERDDSFVQKDNDSTFFVELIPWKYRSGCKFEFFDDMGFLQVNPGDASLSFEGIRERIKIPAASVYSSELIELICKTDHNRELYCVLVRVMEISGIREFLFHCRTVWSSDEFSKAGKLKEMIDTIVRHENIDE